MRRFIYGVGQGVYSTILQRYAIGADTVPCRVCGRDLAVGDHVLAHNERTGYACIHPCGWARLDDVENEQAFRAMVGGVANQSGRIMLERASVRKLELLGVMTVDRATGRTRLTETGVRLRNEARARRAA